MGGGSKIVIILGENISGLWWEDPRLSLFSGRISPDCGERIQDFHFSVGESLRIVGEDPRLSLLGGGISLDCGERIQDFHYSVRESLRIVGGRIQDCHYSVGESLRIVGGRIQDCHYSVGGSLRIVASGIKIFVILCKNLSGLWGFDPRL